MGKVPTGFILFSLHTNPSGSLPRSDCHTLHAEVPHLASACGHPSNMKRHARGVERHARCVERHARCVERHARGVERHARKGAVQREEKCKGRYGVRWRTGWGGEVGMQSTRRGVERHARGGAAQ
eukprot:351964-Chlamydomonas_euryale.AAC.2